MDHENLVIVGRVAGALAIGAMIGFERTFHGRPAGFRTHALVCIASAILMIVTVWPMTPSGPIPRAWRRES